VADIKEWAKGISFFMFVTVFFYFFWNNIFLTIINFLGTDIFGIGAEAVTSLTILKSLGWVSFIVMWLSTAPIYLIFAITAGSRNEVKTQPLQLLKGIGLWTVLMPFLTFIYGIVYYLVTILNGTKIIDSGMEQTATGFSWVLAIIVLIIMTAIPFYYILKGYGIKIGEKQKNGE